ncbi:hypothetical protein [Candidatus Nitrososphaera evergladensis]|uniref:hypothetical protein n=1 Tax=Candidatus Nitrososphaera evergladensis TaxID=1459637 RepID=UPI001D04C19B|nr:hypothetical protein [Candidatus Nitrososphaera evergladensis]
MGVSIIAILNVISGIIMLIGGTGLAAVGSALPTMTTVDPNAGGQMALVGLLGGGAAAVGAVLIVLGIVSFIVAWGLFKGKGWAWTVTIILSAISVIMGIVSLVGGNFGAIVNIIIAGVVIYYLYRPHVKAYFGKTATTSLV